MQTERVEVEAYTFVFAKRLAYVKVQVRKMMPPPFFVVAGTGAANLALALEMQYVSVQSVLVAVQSLVTVWKAWIKSTGGRFCAESY